MNIIMQAYRGSLPENYVEVWRWANLQEVNLWKECSSHIPLGLKDGEHVYVTKPGAKQPGGTGNYLVEFSIPKAMLHKAGKDEWAQVFGPIGNTPVLNLKITGPKSPCS